MIVVIDLHLQVQTGVLSEMSVGVRVLRAEDRSDFVYPSHITRDAHLFGKLRTLGAARERLGRDYGSGEDSNLSEVSRPTEIIHFEHGGARLGGRRLESRRLNLYNTGSAEYYSRLSIRPYLGILRCPEILGKASSLHYVSGRSTGLRVFVDPACGYSVEWSGRLSRGGTLVSPAQI